MSKNHDKSDAWNALVLILQRNKQLKLWGGNYGMDKICQ